MSTINFNDAIFAQEALKQFVADAPWLGAFAHSYNGESADPGANIYVPRVEAITATTFTYSPASGLAYEQDTGTINTITVTLDQQFITTVGSTDLQRANSSAGLIELAQNQGKELAKKVWQRVATLFTTVNFGLAALNTSIANFNHAGSVSIRTVMAKRDVNPKMLSLIVNEDAMNAFLSDSTVYQAYSFGESVAREGTISKIAGMKFYDTNIMPTNGISLVGVVAHPDSVAMACRYLEPQDRTPYTAAFRVVDDASKIVLGYRRHMSAGGGKMYASFEALFGFAVGLSLGLGILTRTD